MPEHKDIWPLIVVGASCIVAMVGIMISVYENMVIPPRMGEAATYEKKFKTAKTENEKLTSSLSTANAKIDELEKKLKSKPPTDSNKKLLEANQKLTAENTTLKSQLKQAKQTNKEQETWFDACLRDRKLLKSELVSCFYEKGLLKEDFLADKLSPTIISNLILRQGEAWIGLGGLVKFEVRSITKNHAHVELSLRDIRNINPVLRTDVNRRAAAGKEFKFRLPVQEFIIRIDEVTDSKSVTISAYQVDDQLPSNKTAPISEFNGGVPGKD